MIAMRRQNTHDDRNAPPASAPASLHPVRYAMLHALTLLGLGMAGVMMGNSD